jgi:hypothetical protein
VQKPSSPSPLKALSNFLLSNLSPSAFSVSDVNTPSSSSDSVRQSSLLTPEKRMDSSIPSQTFSYNTSSKNEDKLAYVSPITSRSPNQPLPSSIPFSALMPLC